MPNSFFEPVSTKYSSEIKKPAKENTVYIDNPKNKRQSPYWDRAEALQKQWNEYYNNAIDAGLETMELAGGPIKPMAAILPLGALKEPIKQMTKKARKLSPTSFDANDPNFAQNHSKFQKGPEVLNEEYKNLMENYFKKDPDIANFDIRGENIINKIPNNVIHPNDQIRNDIKSHFVRNMVGQPTTPAENEMFANKLVNMHNEQMPGVNKRVSDFLHNEDARQYQMYLVDQMYQEGTFMNDFAHNTMAKAQQVLQKNMKVNTKTGQMERNVGPEAKEEFADWVKKNFNFTSGNDPLTVIEEIEQRNNLPFSEWDGNVIELFLSGLIITP